MSLTTTLGPYTAGEIPEPWQHTFTDADGQAIDLTGYSVRLAYRLDGGDQVVRVGSLVSSGAGGVVLYAWVAADLATDGRMEGEMWVGNGTNRYARSFEMTIDPPRGGTAPSI